MSKVSIFGLGYVGCVTAACLTEDGHDVVGVDVVPWKVERLAAGISTVLEPELDELIALARAQGRISATLDAGQAVHDTDVSFICVGTPSRRDGALDLTAVKHTAQVIGRALARKRGPHTIVMRSTAPPGTAQGSLLRTLAAESGRGSDAIDLVVVPEFLREGSAVADYRDPPFVVLGTSTGNSGRMAAVVADLFPRHLDRLRFVSYGEAELLKSLCNVFHALKVTFANEVGALGESLGIDGQRLMQLLVEDTKLNISPSYLRPGLPFGGSCLPKDLRATLSLVNQRCLDLPLLKAVQESNQAHMLRTMAAIHSSGCRRVGLDGLAFKPGTDDLRESPMVLIAEFLIGKGHDLKIYDPAVEVSRLKGANLHFIEEHLPHLSSRLVAQADELLDHAEVLILTRDGSDLAERALRRRPGPLLVDLTGAGRDRRRGPGAARAARSRTATARRATARSREWTTGKGRGREGRQVG